MVSIWLILGVKLLLNFVDLETPIWLYNCRFRASYLPSSSGGIALAKLIKFPLSRALNLVAQVLWFTPYVFMCDSKRSISCWF